jgi:hypothetical protein
VTAFEAYCQYLSDRPNLNCDTCERLFAQGDLAAYPCEICPVNAIEVPDDETSILTLKLLELLGGGPSREVAPPWELLLHAAGISDIETFAECWHRAGIMRRVHEEADRRRHPSKRQGMT